MSKMKSYNTAEYLYVYNNVQIDKITKRLGISRRTLFYWKRKFTWDTKRTNFIKSKNDFHAELTEFTQKLTQHLNISLTNKTPLPNAHYYSLMNLVEYLEK